MAVEISERVFKGEFEATADKMVKSTDDGQCPSITIMCMAILNGLSG